MTRYYFDTHDTGTIQRDDTGTEFDKVEAVRQAAMRLLPDIAREEVPRDGDHRSFAVLVTREDGRPVYSATLAYTGLWLSR